MQFRQSLLFSILTVVTSFLMSCSGHRVDLIVHGAKVYTVDSAFSIVEAFAVKDGKIVATGTSKAIMDAYTADSTFDAGGKSVYPGFIDAHAHFVGYGLSLQTVNLTGAESWAQTVARVDSFRKAQGLGDGKWITGRGWDQNDWAVKDFPTKDLLDTLFPRNPVLLTRVDGHAAIANSAALAAAKLQAGLKLVGGDVMVRNGELTGLLIDNAVDLVSAVIPQPTAPEMQSALVDAEWACFAVGLTTIADCGLDAATVELIGSFQQSDILRMRLYVMLSDLPANYDYLEKRGIIKTDRLHVRSFKVYGDGALGSRGAALLQPYHDQPTNSGFLLSSLAHFDSVAARLIKSPFQMCTHAIGDSANRALLQIYGKYLGGKNDRRWRIEHAQVVHPDDMPMFGKYAIVPSIQPTHATSDMYWAGDRLGPTRLPSAYAYAQLQKQNGWLPLGTDFPVEDISPFMTFYAAVFRRDAKGFPAAGFGKGEALSREQALRGMTIWAARSFFEEDEKGSLERGKWADFVILDKELMTAAESGILGTKVMATFSGGKRVF